MIEKIVVPPAEEPAATHELQSHVEGVDITGGAEKVSFMGAEFRIAEKIGRMPLMKFAAAGEQNLGSMDMAGLAAMYALVRDCIDTTRPQREIGGEMVDVGQSEWDRFEQHAIDVKADDEDFFKVVTDVLEILAARPTRRPSVSSDGPPSTSGSSKAIFSPPQVQDAPAAVVPAFPNAPDPETLGELVSIDEWQQRTGLTRLIA